MKNYIFRSLLILILNCICILLNAQINKSIVVHQNFTTDKELFIFGKISKITGVCISGKTQLNDNNSLIRVVLVDNSGNEYLIFETYPLISQNKNFSFLNKGEETYYLSGLNPKSLRIELINAKLLLNEISYSDKDNKNYNAESLRKIHKKQQLLENIQNIKSKIQYNNMLWFADTTSYTNLSYSQKKILFGEKYNLEGFEYYKGGIFTFYSDIPTIVKSTSYLVSSFDWRNRHGANKSTSPYFDWNPDIHWDGVQEFGNGWMTSIKSQQSWCPCPGTCYIFGPIAALEGIANLYYNSHIDLNLSEQHVLSCDNYNNGCSGGFTNNTLNFIINMGVKDENCFPWAQSELPCNDPSNCTEPDCWFKIDNKLNITGNGDVDGNPEEIKKAIIEYGPLSASLMHSSGGHAMALIGFGVIEVGDTIQSGTGWDPDIIVEEGNSLIGATYWIFKNSGGHNFGDHGYVNLVTNTTLNGQRYLTRVKALLTPLYEITDNSFSILYRDEDNDGFYNWGIGTKPSYCPPCPALADGDDSNPNIGPLDDAGFYSYSLPYNFSFEQDDGTWWQSSNDDIDWTRHSGATPSSGTGPSSAQQGSYYMYVEGSYPNFPYKKAVLISPSFDLSILCNINFSFYYNMYGSNIGNLAVQVSIDGGNSWSNNIWSKSGNQGIGWKNATVNLSSYAGNLVKIKFIAVTGSGINNVLPRSHIIGDSDDIAIDNISLNSSLSSPLIVSNNQTWSSYTSLCQNLTVQSGAILTITGAVIMPKQAIITVKTGSKLIVTGGKITNANIIVESGGELKLENNGICVLNDNDNLTIDNGAEFNFVSGEIK